MANLPRVFKQMHQSLHKVRLKSWKRLSRRTWLNNDHYIYHVTWSSEGEEYVRLCL